MSNSELQQEIESQRNYTSSMNEARYNELMKIAQFGGAEGDNAMEQIDEYLAMEAQQSAFDCRNEA
tara:strand:+ start:333 stop:530 length:198 start_codon:yes stop_codon:yes gene_type:complete